MSSDPFRLAFYKDFLPYCALAALLVRLGLVAASLMPYGYAWTDAEQWLIDDNGRVRDVAQRMCSRSRIFVSKRRENSRVSKQS